MAPKKEDPAKACYKDLKRAAERATSEARKRFSESVQCIYLGQKQEENFYEPDPCKWIDNHQHGWSKTLVTFEWQADAHPPHQCEQRACDARRGNIMKCPLSSLDGLKQRLEDAAHRSSEQHSSLLRLKIQCIYKGQKQTDDFYQSDPDHWVFQ